MFKNLNYIIIKHTFTSHSSCCFRDMLLFSRSVYVSLTYMLFWPHLLIYLYDTRAVQAASTSGISCGMDSPSNDWKQIHPYHLTVYVFILVSLWKKNFMASSDKLWRKARGRHQASMSHVFLPVIMPTTLFGTRRGVSHCSHRSQRIWQKKKLQFCWSSLNFWLKFVWRWSSKFFNFPTVFNTVSGACFFYLIFLYCIFFFLLKSSK